MKQFYIEVQEEASIWQQVGIPSRGDLLFEAINKGLPYEVYNKLADVIQIDKREIADAINLASATLARRAKTGKFTKEESDKFYRLTEVLSASTELFEGDQEAAKRWLKQPAKGLGNKIPIQMLGSSAETEAVLDLIGRLEHGVFV